MMLSTVSANLPVFGAGACARSDGVTNTSERSTRDRIAMRIDVPYFTTAMRTVRAFRPSNIGPFEPAASDGRGLLEPGRAAVFAMDRGESLLIHHSGEAL